jgi:hypothetical protein
MAMERERKETEGGKVIGASIAGEMRNGTVRFGVRGRKSIHQEPRIFAVFLVSY